MRFLPYLVFLVYASGCLGGCNEPYVQIGDKCCLDSNLNAVCDEFEEADLALECELPYIPSSGRCCLDTNGNGVCDDIEEDFQPGGQITTTTESTTSTTTTSTSTTTTSTTSTSTTTTRPEIVISVVPTTTTLGDCFDSDNGDNYNIAGYTWGLTRYPPHNFINRSDFCITNVSIMEYRCEDGKYVYKRDDLCAPDELCLNGRCCLPDGSRCSASKDCCSGVCGQKMMFNMCYTVNDTFRRYPESNESELKSSDLTS